MKKSPTSQVPSAPKLSAKGTANPAAPLLVDAETLASRYGLSPKTIRKYSASGYLPHVKISRRAVRFPVGACDEIIMRRRVSAVSEI
jgi:hypothetical protein